MLSHLMEGDTLVVWRLCVDIAEILGVGFTTLYRHLKEQALRSGPGRHNDVEVVLVTSVRSAVLT